jgi:hypothetical protein
MLVTFILPTQPAGSTGGLVLYKNRTAFAGRARAYPVRVRSMPHTAVMNIISVLSMDWEVACTGGDRAGWGSYGFNTPLTDAYGNPRYICGYAQYMRSNRPRLQFGLPRIDLPPTVYGYPAYTLPAYVFEPTNRQVYVSFDSTDAWANQDGAAMFLWISQPIARTVRRPAERYQPFGLILGSSSGPPASPALIDLPAGYPTAAGARWIRSSISLADGRLSGG